jgi:hypothetical protein
MCKEGDEKVMAKDKKLGPVLTMRGRCPVNVADHKINLFDGRFDTGFKLVSFQIVAKYGTDNSEEASATLYNRKQGTFRRDWNFADVEQVGWAGWMIPLGSRFGVWNLVDDETILVEDIFMSIYAVEEAGDYNYILKLQKYDITEWEGALSLVSRKG